MADRFGYPIEQFAAPGDETRDPASVLAQQIVQVDLLDGNKVILLKEDYDQINSDPSVYNASSFKQAVLARRHAKSEEWQSERGPTSELGKSLESGTPSTDHSSEPPL